MDITGSTALVTGANRGLGRHFAHALLERGAAKVYATARRPDTVDVPHAHVLQLDITDPASVARAVEAAGDVSLLINNAGTAVFQDLLTGDLDRIRLEMETHFWGTLHVTRAFAPVLAASGAGAGGGAVLNVLSVLSWTSSPGATSYSAAKAAEWSLTNATRIELAPQGTQVTGLHVGAVDTDMMAGFDVPKADPADIVRSALDGVAAGDLEVLADDASRFVKAALAGPVADLYPQAATTGAP